MIICISSAFNYWRNLGTNFEFLFGFLFIGLFILISMLIEKYSESQDYKEEIDNKSSENIANY